MLVEGESDVQTLWYHRVPALGVPGAANWREDRDAQHLEGIETIYVVIEPDAGGEAVKKWLSKFVYPAPRVSGHSSRKRCLCTSSGEPG